MSGVITPEIMELCYAHSMDVVTGSYSFPSLAQRIADHIAAIRQPAPESVSRLQPELSTDDNRLSDGDGLVEERARRICVAFNIDPDEIIDPYGPVRKWHSAAYHIGEAIQSLTARLEMVPGWSQDTDGIACRDATIKGLDAQLATERANLLEFQALASVLKDELFAERAKVAELVEGLEIAFDTLRGTGGGRLHPATSPTGALSTTELHRDRCPDTTQITQKGKV